MSPQTFIGASLHDEQDGARGLVSELTLDGHGHAREGGVYVQLE